MSKQSREKQSSTLDLIGMAQAAAAEVEESKNATVPADVEDRVELTPREIVFTLSYDSPNGEDYSDDIKSKVMDADQRLAKTRVVAQLARGLNPDTLSSEDRYRFDALSRVAVQIVQPPEWLIAAIGMDIELLVHVNNILVEHENRYFRGNARKGEGEAVKARVRSAVPAFK